MLLAVAGLLLTGCGGDDGSGGTEGAKGTPKVVLSHGNNSRPYMPWPEDVAKQVAGALERAGFEVEIRQEEWSSYLKMTQNGEHQMALLGWSADVPDADNFLYVLLDKDNARVGSAQNISFYTSEEVHRRLLEARQIGDQAKRMQLYKEAQEIIFEDVPMVPLVYGEKMHANRAAFGAIPVEPMVHPVLRNVATPKDGTLIYLRGNDSTKLDPGDVTDGESSKVIEQVFDQLVRFKSGSTDTEPGLATAWASSDDRKTWTFQIREGVRFHDGTPLDGAAVVNAFERQRDPAHPHHFDDGSWGYWQDLFGFVAKVEVGSHPQEVVFRCSDPAPPFFIPMMAAFNTSIPSPTALTKLGKDFRRNPVGTGPFRFDSWKSGVEIHLERNADYWDGAPALAGVRFLVSENATVRSQRLLSGEQADLIDNLDPQTLDELEADADVRVVRRKGLSVCYLAMNCSKAPFDDVRVRQAVAFALDKQRILRMAYKGVAELATTPVPHAMPGHYAGLVDRKPDVAKAKALLRAAGYRVP